MTTLKSNKMRGISWKLIGALLFTWILAFFTFPQGGEMIHMLPLVSGYLIINKLITGP